MNQEHKELYDKLTRLQKGVCLGILEGKVYTKAYYDAGGLAKSDEYANQIVSRMLSTDVNVIAFMDAMENEAITSAVMTKREALERLSAIAYTSVSDLVEFSTKEFDGAEGEVIKQTVWELKDGYAQNPERMAAISELSTGKDGFKFKLHSSTAAIKELAGMLGWNSPIKQEITGKDGGAIEVADMSDRDKARRIAFLLAKGVRENEQNKE
jgi:phage terminase small subunit